MTPGQPIGNLHLLEKGEMP